MLNGMENLFGQFESAVMAVSAHTSCPTLTYSLEVAEWETEAALDILEVFIGTCEELDLASESKCSSLFVRQCL